MPIRSVQSRPAAAPASADWLFTRLPQWVVDSLTSKQKEAIDGAVATQAWTRPPVHIRFSVPLWRQRFYVTIVSGEEKRSPDRLAAERSRYPLRTAANTFFCVGLAAVVYAMALVGLALFSAIIEI